MKRWLRFMLSFALLTSLLSGTAVQAEDAIGPIQSGENLSVDSLQIGDYVQLGQYDSEPVVWRLMDEDEHGKLMVSDKILCEKPYGETKFWKESFIRSWLNSDVPEGEMDWESQASRYAKFYMKVDEKGFLHESNFNALEKKVMKPVTQWTMLPQDRLDLTENGINTAYTAIKSTTPGSPKDGGGMTFYTITELPEAYVGAAYEITDTIFLLDEMQLYHMWKNFGDIKALMRSDYSREEPLDNTWLKYGGYYSYFLRTPTNSTNTMVGWETDYCRSESGNAGIRPAFYLDEANATILSGSGTAEDPYVVTGKGVRVSFNGGDLQFDQLPIIQDGIVLVPMRAIFEALGAEVTWDEASQTVTASKGDDKITLQIGSSVITKNGSEVDLGYPVILEGERTMVPLNAISESFAIPVDWDADAQQVAISTK